MDIPNNEGKFDSDIEHKERQWTSVMNFDRMRDLVFIIAALFGILAFFRTCSTENKLEEVTYKLASIDHQPKLKASKVKSSLFIDTLNVRASEDVLNHKGTHEDPLPFKVEMAFAAKISVTIENVGDSSIGKIRLLLTTDRSVNFKKFMIDKAYRKNSDVNFKEWPELTNLQILPGESVTLETNVEIRSVENKQFVMHIVIIYANDFGNLYHTYTRIPFTFKPLSLKTIRETKVSELQKELREYIKQKLLNEELMEVGQPISTYEIYSEVESEKVKNYILSFKEK